MTANRIEEIEILRAFAILAVVILHVLATNTISLLENKTILNYIFTIFFTGLHKFSTFAVPLFLLISGFVLGLKYKKDYSLFPYYSKRALTIIPQYVIFSLLYILYAHYSSPEANPISIHNILFKLLTGSAYFHFWFFILIIQFYILFPVINNIMHGFSGEKDGLRVFVISLILQTGWMTLAVHFLSEAEFVSATARLFIIRFFLSSIMYFVLGIFISRHFDFITNRLHQMKLAKPASIIVILCGMLTFISFIEKKQTEAVFMLLSTLDIIISPLLHVYTFIFLFKLSTAVVKSKTHMRPFFIALGKYSFGIYLIHVLILNGISTFSEGIWQNHYSHWEYYILSFIMTVLCSVILLKSATYLPFGSFIIGIKRRTVH